MFLIVSEPKDSDKRVVFFFFQNKYLSVSSVVSSFRTHENLLEDLLKHRIWALFHDLVGFGVSGVELRICNSNQFPDSANSAVSGTTALRTTALECFS